MDLLIDIGNTRLKWARLGPEGLEAPQGFSHYGRIPTRLGTAWETLPRPDRVHIASVADPRIADAVARFCRTQWSREPRWVQTQGRALGVTIAYERPEAFGVDRWLALLGAHDPLGGPALILDAGTAATYDLLDRDGRHLGGVIVPGIELMRRTLTAGTQISQRVLSDVQRPWGTDTPSGIASGSIQSLAALADRLYRRLAETTGTDPRVLLTGGDARRLRPALTVPARHVPDLIFQGFAKLLESSSDLSP